MFEVGEPNVQLHGVAGKAKKRFAVSELREQMMDKAWNRDRAGALLDEIPGAYQGPGAGDGGSGGSGRG